MEMDENQDLPNEIILENLISNHPTNENRWYLYLNVMNDIFLFIPIHFFFNI